MNERVGVTSAGTVELTMRARPENLALARLALAGVATGAGAPPGVVADLKLAVTEACTNAIQHAYPGGDGSDDVVVRFTVSSGTLAIEVEDYGVGFDPDRLPAAREPSGTGGLGLMIIGELADDLSVTSCASGSQVVFRRGFSSAD